MFPSFTFTHLPPSPSLNKSHKLWIPLKTNFLSMSSLFNYLVILTHLSFCRWWRSVKMWNKTLYVTTRLIYITSSKKSSLVIPSSLPKGKSCQLCALLIHPLFELLVYCIFILLFMLAFPTTMNTFRSRRVSYLSFLRAYFNTWLRGGEKGS